MARKKKNPHAKRAHDFVVRVAFDKPCTPFIAFNETKQAMRGQEHSCDGLYDGSPGYFTVKSVKRMPPQPQRPVKAR